MDEQTQVARGLKQTKHVGRPDARGISGAVMAERAT